VTINEGILFIFLKINTHHTVKKRVFAISLDWVCTATSMVQSRSSSNVLLVTTAAPTRHLEVHLVKLFFYIIMNHVNHINNPYTPFGCTVLEHRIGNWNWLHGFSCLVGFGIED
jgi:hypothetical protein